MAEQQQQYTPSSVHEARTRERIRQERLIDYLGDMLVPQTEGYDHVNLDMSFTYLGNSDLVIVDNLCLLITYCYVNKFKQTEYMLRGQLAAFLNSRRSRNAKSMDMFTTVTTKQDQVFEDKTIESQKRFGWDMIGKKK